MIERVRAPSQTLPVVRLENATAALGTHGLGLGNESIDEAEAGIEAKAEAEAEVGTVVIPGVMGFVTGTAIENVTENDHETANVTVKKIVRETVTVNENGKETVTATVTVTSETGPGTEKGMVKRTETGRGNGLLVNRNAVEKLMQRRRTGMTNVRRKHERSDENRIDHRTVIVNEAGNENGSVTEKRNARRRSARNRLPLPP